MAVTRYMNREEEGPGAGQRCVHFLRLPSSFLLSFLQSLLLGRAALAGPPALLILPCPPSPCISFSSFIQNKSSAPPRPFNPSASLTSLGPSRRSFFSKPTLPAFLFTSTLSQWETWCGTNTVATSL